MATIHDEVREKVELAFTYAEDGAFFTAARILKSASDIYNKRALQIQKEILATPPVDHADE